MKRYQIVVTRAAVLDAIDALYHPNLRADAILGYVEYGVTFDGTPVALPISADLTAHAVQITYPLDKSPHAGVIAYLMRSSVREVLL